MQLITNEFNRLGEVLKPTEVSKLLKINIKTVKKHADELGGVEIYPGCYRFFSKIILDKFKMLLMSENLNAEKAATNKKVISENKQPKIEPLSQDRHSIFN
ncbi:MAG: hypothetical protein OMM_11077 [Candidatus Magnetoglobus multicellularis str. Araruama]|uniref:Uncharacterized protein n=1 Tax=Candidatus Magnetoglobus multicellularis str. Araruama TaxID=890399 RepID=A0A1V1NZD3_9BACT|nr:MAG: hypothetical protein OMM_11077 [Candidatus Magnetoglobus multicellularis str. Araruama]